MKCVKCGCEFSGGMFCPECGTRSQEDFAESPIVNSENRELEVERARAEQERFAKERAEQEAEILKQQNEKMRLEEELLSRRRAEEMQKEEELSRTFNGKVYRTVEEMQTAKSEYENRVIIEKQRKRIDTAALLCMILGIAVYPLTLTIVLWLPALIGSIILGVNAYKGNTNKKGMVITGILLDIIFLIIIIIN